MRMIWMLGLGVVMLAGCGGAADDVAPHGGEAAPDEWLEAGEIVTGPAPHVQAASAGVARVIEPAEVGVRPIIYFGQLEVMGGALKSASGVAPSRGEEVVLRLFLPELASFLCREYCMALAPQLMVRFRGDEDFVEVPGIPAGEYFARGPQAYWPQSVANVLLRMPADADRIEVYMYFGRISWSGFSCYLAYDMMECPGSFAIEGAFLSNYGKNFLIMEKGVRPLF